MRADGAYTVCGAVTAVTEAQHVRCKQLSRSFCCLRGRRASQPTGLGPTTVRMRRPRDWWGACVRGGRGGGMARKGDTGDLGRDRDGGCGTAGRRAGGQADEEESGLERQRQDKASRRRIATADVMLHRGASVLLLSCVCGSRLGKALDARRELRRQPMQPRSAAHACAWVRLRIGELKTDTYVRRNRVSVSRPAGSQQASVSAAFVRGGTSSSRWCMGRVAAHDDGWLGG